MWKRFGGKNENDIDKSLSCCSRIEIKLMKIEKKKRVLNKMRKIAKRIRMKTDFMELLTII